MATMGPQNPTLVQPGTDPVGQGIQNRVANYGDSTLADRVVLLADDQSVADVKTFVKSPIVPTPTTDYQAATKKYVDDRFIGWDDIFGDISQGTAAAALTYEAVRDTPFLGYHFRASQLDSLSMRFQMPHSWDAAVAPVPHLHVTPLAAPSPSPRNVHLSGYWCWTQPDVVIPALSGWTPWTADLEVATADQFKTFYVNIENVTVPAGLKGSAILLVYLQRDGGVGTDTYTQGKGYGTTSANLLLTSFDCHVKKVRFGSPTPAPV
jgi:hypothetical protein